MNYGESSNVGYYKRSYTSSRLKGYVFKHKFSNTAEDARIDVSARSFRVYRQMAFSNIRFSNPLVNCYNSKTLKSIFEIHEKKKNRCYNNVLLKQKIVPLLR